MDAPLFDIPRHSAAHGCTAYRKELGGRSVDAHQCCIVEHVRTDTPARSHVRSAAALRMKNSVRDSLSHVKPSKERLHRVIFGVQPARENYVRGEQDGIPAKTRNRNCNARHGQCRCNRWYAGGR
ncbi:hypothetical protein EMIT0111MI5_180123 [Burkholderia sp. IT-111MI5]